MPDLYHTNTKHFHPIYILSLNVPAFFLTHLTASTPPAPPPPHPPPPPQNTNVPALRREMRDHIRLSRRIHVAVLVLEQHSFPGGGSGSSKATVGGGHERGRRREAAAAAAAAAASAAAAAAAVGRAGRVDMEGHGDVGVGLV